MLKRASAFPLIDFSHPRRTRIENGIKFLIYLSPVLSLDQFETGSWPTWSPSLRSSVSGAFVRVLAAIGGREVRKPRTEIQPPQRLRLLRYTLRLFLLDSHLEPSIFQVRRWVEVKETGSGHRHLRSTVDQYSIPFRFASLFTSS